ncbi:MAG: hypothetical protein QM778_20930 [Myxococcales bacterium]
MPFLAWIVGALLWLVVDGGELAHAQAAQAAPPQGEVGHSRDDEARALFEAGKVAYEDGRYVDSLGYFERAYELSQRSALQYNIGLAYDRLRRDREAVAAFETYLNHEPDPERVSEVQNRVRALRASLAEAEANEQARADAAKRSAVPLAPTPANTREHSERTRKRRLWGGVAAAVVAVSAGVIISVLAAGKDGDERPKPNSGVTIEALSWH